MKYIFLFLTILILAGCGETAVSDTSPNTLPPLNAQQVAQGEEIYIQHCASCHGANLEGQAPDWQKPFADGSMKAPPHDETGHTWHHGDAQLLEAIRLGASRAPDIGSTMPAYEEVLTDEEMTAVLTYIKSRWPENIRQNQWKRTQLEQSLNQ